MKLYHFTSQTLFQRIKGQGLKKGVIPQMIGNQVSGYLGPFQWLTEIPDWSQDWAMRVPEFWEKLQVRIEIEIPRKCIQDRLLVRWPDFAIAEYKKKVHPEFAQMCAENPSSKYWWIFRAHIPKSWFSAYARPDHTKQNDSRN